MLSHFPFGNKSMLLTRHWSAAVRRGRGLVAGSPLRLGRGNWERPSAKEQSWLARGRWSGELL